MRTTLAIIAGIILLTGCTAPTQNDNIVCNEPYIRYESGCCLDKDANQICDEHQEEEESQQIQENHETELEKLREELGEPKCENGSWEPLTNEGETYSSIEEIYQLISERTGKSIETVAEEMMKELQQGGEGLRWRKNNGIIETCVTTFTK